MNLIYPIGQLKKTVQELNEQEPNISVSEMANRLDLSEGEVTLALPSQYVSIYSGDKTQTILETLPAWGRVTTIIHSHGSIFEAKAPFPKGKVAHGYYNLMGRKDGELNGHLKIDLVTDVACVSKPFKGMESYFIGFYDQAGNCIFKVYLGRDKKRQIIAGQIELFNRLKKDLSNGK